MWLRSEWWMNYGEWRCERQGKGKVTERHCLADHMTGIISIIFTFIWSFNLIHSFVCLFAQPFAVPPHLISHILSFFPSLPYSHHMTSFRNCTRKYSNDIMSLMTLLLGEGEREPWLNRPRVAGARRRDGGVENSYADTDWMLHISLAHYEDWFFLFLFFLPFFDSFNGLERSYCGYIMHKWRAFIIKLIKL